MISKAASTISEWLLSSGAISEKDRSLYEYAAYSFIFSLVPLVIVAIIGSILGMLAEGIILILQPVDKVPIGRAKALTMGTLLW